MYDESLFCCDAPFSVSKQKEKKEDNYTRTLNGKCEFTYIYFFVKKH